MNLTKTIQYLATMWLTVIIAISVSIGVERYIPTLEGAAYPVILRASVIDMEYVGPNLTRVSLETEKVRDCPYNEVEWWYGLKPPGNSIPIPVVYEGRVKMYPVGKVKLGPWLVGMSIEEMKDQSYAFISHRCHILWNTRSLVYESEKSPS